MSLRQLRARLDRLEVQLPGDEESIARARYEHLHLRIGRGELELLTDAEKSEHSELFMNLCVHLPPATTDEDRAGRARWNDLRRKESSARRGETLEPLTEPEETEHHKLAIRYHFLGKEIAALLDEMGKHRAKKEERSRLRPPERRKKAAGADADSTYYPDEIGRTGTSRSWQIEGKRKAAAASAAVRVDYTDDSDCWPIGGEGHLATSSVIDGLVPCTNGAAFCSRDPAILRA